MDPVYHYIKGEGWVVTRLPTITIKDITYTAEPRLPNPNEFYIYEDKGYYWDGPNGTLNFDKAIEELKRNPGNYCVFQNTHPEKRAPRICHYITLTPVD